MEDLRDLIKREGHLHETWSESVSSPQDSNIWAAVRIDAMNEETQVTLSAKYARLEVDTVDWNDDRMLANTGQIKEYVRSQIAPGPSPQPAPTESYWVKSNDGTLSVNQDVRGLFVEVADTVSLRGKGVVIQSKDEPLALVGKTLARSEHKEWDWTKDEEDNHIVTAKDIKVYVTAMIAAIPTPSPSPGPDPTPTPSPVYPKPNARVAQYEDDLQANQRKIDIIVEGKYDDCTMQFHMVDGSFLPVNGKYGSDVKRTTFYVSIPRAGAGSPLKEDAGYMFMPNSSKQDVIDGNGCIGRFPIMAAGEDD